MLKRNSKVKVHFKYAGKLTGEVNWFLLFVYLFIRDFQLDKSSQNFPQERLEPTRALQLKVFLSSCVILSRDSCKLRTTNVYGALKMSTKSSQYFSLVSGTKIWQNNIQSDVKMETSILRQKCYHYYFLRRCSLIHRLVFQEFQQVGDKIAHNTSPRFANCVTVDTL